MKVNANHGQPQLQLLTPSWLSRMGEYVIFIAEQVTAHPLNVRSEFQYGRIVSSSAKATVLNCTTSSAALALATILQTHTQTPLSHTTLHVNSGFYYLGRWTGIYIFWTVTYH